MAAASRAKKMRL